MENKDSTDITYIENNESKIIKPRILTISSEYKYDFYLHIEFAIPNDDAYVVSFRDEGYNKSLHCREGCDIFYPIGKSMYKNDDKQIEEINELYKKYNMSNLDIKESDNLIKLWDPTYVLSIHYSKSGSIINTFRLSFQIVSESIVQITKEIINRDNKESVKIERNRLNTLLQRLNEALGRSKTEMDNLFLNPTNNIDIGHIGSLTVEHRRISKEINTIEDQLKHIGPPIDYEIYYININENDLSINLDDVFFLKLDLTQITKPVKIYRQIGTQQTL